MFDIVPYEFVLGVHVTSFVFNIGLVILADIFALLWVFGKKTTLNARVMSTLHRLLWAGLVVSIVTGGMLFWDLRSYLLTVPAFYVKMLLVVALIINSFFIHRHLSTALNLPYSELSSSEKKPLYISGIISTFSWVGVAVAAQFLGP